MRNPVCDICGTKMMKNGRTKAGTQRWRCGRCGASLTRKIDNTAKLLKLFVSWLLGRLTHSQLGMSARAFRKKTGRFWKLWPILPVCDEIHHVIYMDGLWLARGKAILLIACTDSYIIGCHLAKTENSKDWGCLMSRIAPPDVLVCDGSGGIEKARRAYWPNTSVQRCLFHVFDQVKRCTTTKPKLQAGVELYGIAKNLMHVADLNGAAAWLAAFANWCTTWEEFLKERTVVDGRSQYKHERLRKARRILEKLCREGTLFTYLDEKLVEKGYIPSTSNKIESNNSRIREILRDHRGMNIEHRIKAGFWWCYMHSEAPLSYAKALQAMPNDEQVLEWRRQAANAYETGEEVARWGTGIVWSELHKCGSKYTGWF